MRPRFPSKKEREAAFNLVLSELDTRADVADWVSNEMQVFLVKVSLGGAYAVEAVTDLTDKRLGLAEGSKLCGACLTIGESPNLQQVAERIVLFWTLALAAGKPIDCRWRALIAEWCRQRLEPAGRGRPQDSPIKKFAVVSRLLETAAKYPGGVYGAKKQRYGDLQTAFGLKRSQ
jgi:hypothetical protein